MAIFVAMLLPALATTYETGNRIARLTHFKQIGPAVTPWTYTRKNKLPI